MKLTKKQIETIRRNTPEELKGKQAHIVETLGYYTPAGANWSWRAGWTMDGLFVVTRFDEIM